MTQSELKNLLTYEPESGKFFWNVSPANNVKVGDEAGSINSRNYIVITICGESWLAHRLAFLYMKGYIPEMVDHIFHNTLDNRWKMLRESDRCTNQFNTKRNIRNTSGVKGVSWHKKSGKWQVRITVRRQLINIGLYDNLEDAKTAIFSARLKYHGKFAKV